MRAGTACFELMKRAPSSALAAEDMIDLMIYEMFNTAPLLGGLAALFDIKKWPPARLRALLSDRYDASLWIAKVMLLILNDRTASG